jgi:hypothetical protein
MRNEYNNKNNKNKNNKNKNATSTTSTTTTTATTKTTTTTTTTTTPKDIYYSGISIPGGQVAAGCVGESVATINVQVTASE